MATPNWLTQYQSIKSSTEYMIVAIEDLSDLWPSVKDLFEARIPLKRTNLNNKARISTSVEKLPMEFVLTTDPRLRARFQLEQSPFLFRLPYATILLLTCEDLDDYKSILKPRIKLMIQNEDREWFIVFVTKAVPQDPSGKQAKRIYSKLEVDFNTKRRERCCKLDINSSDAISWEEIEMRLTECIRNTLDRRIQSYEDEVRRLNETRSTFTSIFIVKESLAFTFELAHLYEDALREYDELEQIYVELVNTPASKPREFGGTTPGDDCAALLDVSRKTITQFATDDCFKEFDFRQYLFAHEAALLFHMNRPIDVASRGLAFVYHFSQLLFMRQRELPFCMREVWVITACVALLKATQERFSPRSFNPDFEREFYRFQADLNALARTKLMRLADLIGYGSFLQGSPCNSALLSMTPWPKPSVWPSVPSDAGAKILAKEQDLQEKSKASTAPQTSLPLAPTMLLREANRRRASLSAGNVSELSENRFSFKESPAGEGPASPSQASPTSSMQRTSSAGSPRALATPSLSPSLSRSSFDRPMKLAEVHAAAEHEILKLVTHEGLKKSLSSIQGFEEMYMALTREAADYYHRSRKRHGVVLDGEIAAVHYRKGNFDTAGKLYEKLCALYSGEHWDSLLAEVLPPLADCQKQLGDHAGFLFSSVKLLSLDRRLLPADVRKSLQSDLLSVAHCGLKVPVPVDVSALITFFGKPGPPLELCEGDVGTLPITIWSGFPDEITLDSLSMALSSAYNTDDGSKAIKSAELPVLKPGKNTIIMQLQPQKPGSYVLSTFTGQIGQVKLRSHAYCTVSAGSSKGGPPESDDYLSTEKPVRPVLQVLPPRALVEIKVAVSSGLLIGDPQWVGLVIRPLGYSLKGAIIHVSPLQGIALYGEGLCQLQHHNKVFSADNSATVIQKHKGNLENGIIAAEDTQVLEMKNGSVELPEWSSDAVSIMWFQVLAKRLKDCREADAQHVSADGAVASMKRADDIAKSDRSLNVKLEFGVTRNRIYERTISVTFMEAFRASTHLVKKGNAGMFLLQVILMSQINAAVTLFDASLTLQSGFLHSGSKEGKPDPLCLLPISMAGNSDCALLFILKTDPDNDDKGNETSDRSILTVNYKIIGNRASGAHATGESQTFRTSFFLQMPVLDRLVAVGMLPVPCSRPRVGQKVVLQWRIERLKRAPASDSSAETEELPYEIKASSETWMVAGKRKGYVSLPMVQGARAVISMACVPLVAGHVHPPALDLCLVNQAHISHSPPCPHLVCIFPPVPSSAFCLTTKTLAA